MSCAPLIEAAAIEKFCGCSLNDLQVGDVESSPEEIVADAILSAGRSLEDMAQIELGRCEHVLRPCRDGCREVACGCCQLSGIILRGIEPTVVQVRVDGAIVDPDLYAVITDTMGRPSLERFHADGRPNHWPGCQHLGKAPTEEGTFEIIVETGREMDLIARHAVAEIACYILEPYFPRNGEELPDGTTTMNGYGITATLARDVADSEGQEFEVYAGLPWVRRFLGLPSVAGRRNSARVWSPEISDGYSTYLVTS